MTIRSLFQAVSPKRRRGLRVVTTLVLVAALLEPGFAQSGRSSFTATIAMSCEPLIVQSEDLVHLVDRNADDSDLAFTRAIPGRLEEFIALRSELDALRPLRIPYAGEDLSELPRPAAPPLLPTTETRTYSVRGYEDDARVAIALGSVAFSIGVGLLADNVISSGPSRNDGFAIGSMTLMFGAVGVTSAALQLFLTFQETETTQLPSNVRINEQRRAEYTQDLLRVNGENTDRLRKRQEQAAVIEANERIAAERLRLEERLREFGAESRRIVIDRIADLDRASLRCLDRLVYAGAVVRHSSGAPASRITLAVTPIARSGQAMLSSNPASEFRFTIDGLVLSSTGAVRADLASPRVVDVRPFDADEFPLLPVTVMVVVDSSGSMSSNDPRGLRREGLVRFFDQAPPGARIGVMEFGNRGGRVLAPITEDMDALKRAVQGVRASGGTPLYASGRDALTLLRADGGEGRLVLVMLSDGLPDGDDVTSDQFIEEARHLRVPVYTIGLGNVNFSEFERVAVETGGAFSAAANADAVVEALAGLGVILNALYAVDVDVPSTAIERFGSSPSLLEIGGAVTVEHEGLRASNRIIGSAPFLLR